MNNKLSKSERTRQFIIETTAGIFNAKGYAGTSLSDLTEATGLTKGSIYGNFESKEEVALAAFDHNLSILQGIIQPELAKAKTWTDKLMVYSKVYHSFNKTPFPNGGCPILNTAVDADDTNNLLKDRAAKAVQGWRKTIETIIQNGIKAGEFKPETDHVRMALSIIAMIEGATMIARVTNNAANLDKVLITVGELVNAIKT